MSKTTIALEAAVAVVIANTPGEGVKQTARQRAEVDRAFARILKLIAPRIRHFIRQYGLSAHWDDAEQACAIAVHRAIQSYEPEKAQFTTFVNWQIRGELQSLRFRVMTDQRPSAKKVEATTVSLNVLAQGPDGEETTLESVIEDEGAMELTEAAASDYLADAAMRSLVDSYIDHLRTTAIGQMKRRPRPKRQPQPCEIGGGMMAPRARHALNVDIEEMDKLDQRLKRNRDIVEARLFGLTNSDAIDEDSGITKERVRQITKRAAKTIAELVGSEPKFQMMANYRKSGMLRTRPRAPKIDPVIAATMYPSSVIITDRAPVSEAMPASPMEDIAALEAMIGWTRTAVPASSMRH